MCAILDFGCLGVGDPAGDTITEWFFLSAETRNSFRAALEIDDANWTKGRGWGLSVSVIALPYYRVTNLALAEIARLTIAETIEDYQINSRQIYSPLFTSLPTLRLIASTIVLAGNAGARCRRSGRKLGI